MNELDAWVAAAARELALEPGDVQTDVVLDVARDVAHQVVRPAAPLTAYLMGVAVGRGADPADAAARISTLALAWSPPRPGDVPPPEGEVPPEGEISGAGEPAPGRAETVAGQPAQ